jgi:hypothetical protein
MNVEKLLKLRDLANELIAEASGEPAAVHAPSDPLPGEIGEKLPYAANQVRTFSFYHGGGTLELKVDAVPGKGTFNTLTESLTGPGPGFVGRKSSPAGTLKSHQAVAEPMPPGTYTYSVSADVDTWLVVIKIQ